MAPCFLNVADANGQFSLADLKGGNYDPRDTDWDDEWIGGCKPGDLQVEVLNDMGIPDFTYQWQDFIDTDEYDYQPEDVKCGWYLVTVDPETSEIVYTRVENPSAIKFDIGTAFSILNMNGETRTLVSAGEVTKDDISYDTIYGYILIGNGTAADLTLNDLYGEGYDPRDTDWDDEWIGGCKPGDIQLEVLNDMGIPDFTYQWQDFIDTDEYEYQPEDVKCGWFNVTVDPETSEIVYTKIADPSAISVPAGAAFSVLNMNGESRSLHIPAVELK